MIVPTVGRVVWFFEREAVLGAKGHALAAIVTHVHHERLVNLVVFDASGGSHGRTSVRLQQPGDPNDSAEYCWCEWMPYQVGQAQRRQADAAAKYPGNGTPNR